MRFFSPYILFPVLCVTLVYKVILFWIYWNGSEREAVSYQLLIRSQLWSMTAISCYFWLTFNFFLMLFTRSHKASAVQYSSFPRDPRKPILLSAGLVRLNAGTVEVFIFGWAALCLCTVQRHQPLDIRGLWRQHSTVPDDWRKTFCHPIFVWVDTSLLLSRRLEWFVFFNSSYLTVFPGIPCEK